MCCAAVWCALPLSNGVITFSNSLIIDCLFVLLTKLIIFEIIFFAVKSSCNNSRKISLSAIILTIEAKELLTYLLVINHEMADILYITIIGVYVAAHSRVAVPEETIAKSAVCKACSIGLLIMEMLLYLDIIFLKFLLEAPGAFII